MDFQADVDAALKKLGDTPDAIAESLFNLGVTGSSITRGCPLAVYLQKELQMDEIQVGRTLAYTEDALAVMKLPAQNFVTMFDLDGYRFLRGAPKYRHPVVAKLRRLFSFRQTYV